MKPVISSSIYSVISLRAFAVWGNFVNIGTLTHRCPHTFITIRLFRKFSIQLHKKIDAIFARRLRILRSSKQVGCILFTTYYTLTILLWMGSSARQEREETLVKPFERTTLLLLCLKYTFTAMVLSLSYSFPLTHSHTFSTSSVNIFISLFIQFFSCCRSRLSSEDEKVLLRALLHA